MKIPVLIILGVLAIGGCSNEPTPPQGPAILTVAANGHYCQMTVVDHPGPKAQVHLAGRAEPLWFTQVRDAFAYQRSPETSAEVTAVYVSDMGVAESWEDPGAENWIEVETAYFVTGSGRRGGMGAPEIVPFGSADAAANFVAHHSGSIIRIDEISDAMVLDPVDVDPGIPSAVPPADGHGPHGDHGGRGSSGGA